VAHANFAMRHFCTQNEVEEVIIMKFWKVMALTLVAILMLSPMQAFAEAASAAVRR
jgi:hypothetical protein